MFLVLDRGSHTLGDPIDGTRRGSEDLFGVDREGTERLAGLESEHLGAEFFSAHVGELSVSEGGVRRSCVQVGNLLSGQNEVSESSLSLFGGLVCLVPEGIVFIERNASRQGGTSRGIDLARSEEAKAKEEEQR